MDSKSVIKKLKEGNAKYICAKYNDGDISAKVRKETAENGQRPYAVVITCSDSRVVPEDIFMSGIGELFVIRVAGNVVDDMQLSICESIQF